MIYHEGRSWAETAKVLDFLKQYSDNYADGIYNTIENLFSYFEVNKKEEDEFFINKLQWLIDNGANVNYHRRNNTAIDLIQDYTSGKDSMKYNEETIVLCRNLLLQHGAMSMEELMAEESKNNDYHIELRKMKQ